MKTLIATSALASIVATTAVAQTDLAQLNRSYRNYLCPDYQNTAHCSVQKEPNMAPNDGRQNGQENFNKKP